jgi:chloramphenicol 3-O-phosphotransferase
VPDATSFRRREDQVADRRSGFSTGWDRDLHFVAMDFLYRDIWKNRPY